MNVVRSNRPKVGVIKYSEIIVIGSGIAGMFAALRLAPRKVTLLTKTPSLTGGSTAWAQGGIAGAVGLTDSPQEHASDTILAGAGLNVSSAVEVLTTEGADRLNELISMGAPFDRDDKGKIILLDIDVKGTCTLMEEFEDDVISIFIEPPGEDINEQIESVQERLKDRGQESETLIKQRTKRLQLEMEYKEKFHFHFVNDDLKKTTDKIEKTIRRKIK